MVDPANNRFAHAILGIKQWLAGAFPLPNVRKPDFCCRLCEAHARKRLNDQEVHYVAELWAWYQPLVHASL